MGKIFGDSFLLKVREAKDEYNMGKIMEEAFFVKRAVEAGIDYVKKNANSIKGTIINDLLNYGRVSQVMILRYNDFYKELSLPEDPLFETPDIEKCMDAVAETVVCLLIKEGINASIPSSYFYNCSIIEFDKGESNIGRRGIEISIPKLKVS